MSKVSDSISNEPTGSSLFNFKTIVLICDIVLFFLLYNLLPFDPDVVVGLSILVFVAVLWLTEALHVSITAILVPVLAVACGVFETKAALTNFAHPIVFLFLGGFALAAALHAQQLDLALARKVIALAKGRLDLAALMLFGVSAGLSMWISNTATTAMMLPLILGLLEEVRGGDRHRTRVFFLLGTAYCASIGGIATLVGSPPNAIAAAQTHVDFLQWMRMALPVTVILLPLAVVVLYLILRPNLSQRFEVENEPFVWTTPRLLTLVIFVITALAWISSSFLKGLLPNISDMDTVIALCAILLLGVARVVDWKAIERATDWGALILFGGGLCLSAILKTTGTTVFLADVLSHWLGHAGPLTVLLVIVAFVVFLTELASNTASAALLVPVFAGIAESFGLPPVVLATAIAVAASCAFMLPVATPPNAIVFGSGMIRQREMMWVGFWLNLVCITVVTAFARWVW